MTVIYLDRAASADVDSFLAERSRAEKSLRDAFLAAIRKGDVSAPAYFAPKVRRGNLMRYPYLWEVLTEAMDGSGADHMEAMRILCAVAYGSEPQTLAARELLDRMAGKWADFAYRGE